MTTLTSSTDALTEWVASLTPAQRKILTVSAGRRALTRLDPLAFAMVYMRHHLRSPETGGQVTLSPVHREWCDLALNLAREVTSPRQYRDIYVAPRSMGKTSWHFLLIPMWAAAHGHSRFIGAFADSATQAEMHLSTFKRELEVNELLRKDYPELCAPARRARGTAVSDSRALMQQSNGFSFAARGADAASLGMKIGELRPDLIVLDDVEPSGGSYSAYQAERRLDTLTQSILPLNDFARVSFVGTVTMDGSLIHQAVRSVTQASEVADWVKAEDFTVHYYPALIPQDDGSEQSVWPEKWSVEWLQSIRGTRAFMLNFQNQPVALDGTYWSPEVYRYGEPDGVSQVMISVDPAVSTKTSSDYTGLAVVGFSPVTRQCVVYHAEQVKMTGTELKQRAVTLLEMYPSVSALLVESNQGGGLWTEVFKGLPIKVATMANTLKKEIRAAAVVNYYERGLVLHAAKLPLLEGQQCGFPRGVHDDMVDAVGTAVQWFLGSQRKTVLKQAVR